MHVLMIEDNEDDFLLFSRYATKIGDVTVEWQETVENGLIYLASNAADIILLDMNLPDGHGLPALDRLQARFPAVPVIILTGSGDDEMALEAVRHGAQDYLVKGEVDTEMLRRALRYAIQRKQIEQELVAERNLLRTLIDTIPDHIFVKDRQGRFLLVNQMVVMDSAMKAEQIIGKSDFDFFSEPVARGFFEIEQQIIATGEGFLNKEEEVPFISPESSKIWVLSSKMPLRDEKGQIIGLVGNNRNITERKQLEAQAMELAAERERIQIIQRFISDMSHDFRTPLTILTNSLYLMQRVNDPTNQQAQLQTMKQQVVRLSELLNALMEMLQLDRQPSNLQLDLTEINDFLRPLVQHYLPAAAAKQIDMRFVPAVDACFAAINANEFARAVTKILENALAYTHEGSITVRIVAHNGLMTISVQDTGIGITESDLPHIFERFYRVDQARPTTTGGHGLGLSIAQRIVQAHGGKVTVESTFGEGSTFSIQLPLRAP